MSTDPRDDRDAAGLRRVWADVSHSDAGDLGQYAALVRRSGAEAATEAFPEVAAHLARGCQRCAAQVAELLRLLASDETSPDHEDATR